MGPWGALSVGLPAKTSVADCRFWHPEVHCWNSLGSSSRSNPRSLQRAVWATRPEPKRPAGPGAGRSGEPRTGHRTLRELCMAAAAVSGDGMMMTAKAAGAVVWFQGATSSAMA